jgi:hypothetical protein
MLRKLIFATILVLGFSAASQAVVLTGSGPGFTDFAITGTTAADKPTLAGAIIEDLLTPFSISGAGETLSGEIQNRVVRSLDGTLDFYWRILPANGNGDISAFRLGGFEGFTLDADWRPDGLGDIGPNVARYFGDGSGAVNFLFDSEVGTDVTGFLSSSNFFYLDTAALDYDMSGRFDLLCADSGCISQSYSTFSPTVIPVPAAIWLFGTALIGVVGFSKRRKEA